MIKMKLRVTTICSEEVSELLRVVSTTLEDDFRSIFDGREFGGEISQLMVVLIALFDSDEDNVDLSNKENRVSGAKDITGKRIKYMSIGVPLNPGELLKIGIDDVFEIVRQKIVESLDSKRVKVPKGFDYDGLVDHVSEQFGIDRSKRINVKTDGVTH